MNVSKREGPASILLVKEGRNLYGAEEATLRMLRAVDLTLIQPRLLVYEYDDEPSEFLTAVIGLEFEVTVARSNTECRESIILEASKRDLSAVIAIGYKCHVLTWWATRYLTIPRFGIVHGWVNTDLRLRAYNYIARTCLSRFDGVITVSPTINVQNPRTACIYNGVLVKELEEKASQETDGPQLPENKPYILYVGRLSPEKGLDELLDVVVPLVCRANLVLVGDGKSREHLEARVRALEISDSVIFTGHVHNPWPYMRNAQMLVLPSHTEGTPLVLLEAMALRTPVIASAVGGVPDIIEDGRNGLLIQPRDRDALRVAIESLLEDSPRRDDMRGMAFQTIIGKFSEAGVAERFQQILLGWLDEMEQVDQ